jgi:Polyketide cyclase / dehydrase and lipid transport
MKVFLIVLGSILLLVVAVVGIGALLPAHHIAARSANYRATPDRLFALIEGSQNWRPDVLHSETWSDSSGRRMLRETTRGGQSMIYEISAIDPPRSLTRRIAMQNLPFAGSWTYSLQPSPSGTTVRITEDAEIYNPVFRFVTRFILGETRTIDAYLRALGKATGQEVEPGS